MDDEPERRTSESKIPQPRDGTSQDDGSPLVPDLDEPEGDEEAEG